MLKIRAFCPLIALACLHVSAGPLLAQRKRTPPPPAIESNAKAWQLFISTEGRFSVHMPGTPEKSGQVLSTGVGSLPSFSFTLKTGMAEYLISYMDFPSAFDDPTALKAAYDGGRDETLSSNQLTLVGDRDISVESHIGRHITAVGKGQLFNNRIVAVSKRLYQVVIVTRDYRKYSPARIRLFESTINRFLDSFKLILSLAGSNTSVAEKTTEAGSLDMGRMENSNYINDFFSFRVSLPESWHHVERETSDAALQVGKEMVKGSDKQVNVGIDQSMAKTFIFFSITKFPLRTPNVTQAMMQCGVEKLSDKRMTARIYLEKSRNLALGSPLQFKLLRDVYPETIAGLSFFVMDMQLSVSGVTVKQKYYSTLRKGYALFFVTNYFDEADRMSLEKILQTAKFE